MVAVAEIPSPLDCNNLIYVANEYFTLADCSNEITITTSYTTQWNEIPIKQNGICCQSKAEIQSSRKFLSVATH